MSKWDPDNPAYCDTFWGSHGCSLDAGHKGPCQCITNFYGEDGEVVETSNEGNCAPPYFGPDTHFMSNHDTPTPAATLRAATLGGGWDWEAIAASDYPVVPVEGSDRNRVYCEFWSPSKDNEAYSYLTGIVIPWLEWLDLRETPAGEGLKASMFSPLRGGDVELHSYTRARFSIWTAFTNPRFPYHTIGLWSLESGF